MPSNTWPAMTDYVAMIAYPNQFLSDSILKVSRVAFNSLDMPLTWCGANAIVFRLSHKGKTWAVRCFTRAIRDRPDRYAHLQSHLTSSLTSSVLVDFTYLNKGILVSGNWYPVVKMDWVEGETLEYAIESYVNENNTSALYQLGDTWADVVLYLRSHNIAHGDLQHDNIIVSNGEIKLVDYDGMYVPSLKGRDSLELGLSHYQHPARTEKHFDENLDNFSSIVIYLTLRSLASDLSLWKRFHVEKRLLLSEDDYKDPDNSAVFQAMRNCRNVEVGKLADTLCTVCKGPVTATPSLSSLISRQTAAGQIKPRERFGQIPNWMQSPVNSSLSVTRPTSEDIPSWLDLKDHETEPSAGSVSKPIQDRPKSDTVPDWMKPGK